MALTGPADPRTKMMRAGFAKLPGKGIDPTTTDMDRS
jgi:hypothetical protein